ncbi:caspase-1-like [Sitodiplosis mosellana]|uniref:caspase-1-like n=1 Tax=Sitodiplosis mosellana TaxID=263140 RepID=UPI002443F3D5|nr:caspase-1-like [Sitodiplosis mosellana]
MGYASIDKSAGDMNNECETFNQDNYHSNYCYNMCHKKRGLALIFNHEYFSKQRQRRGTHIDRDRLHDTFKSLDFKVKIYENKTKLEILAILQKVAAKDHSNKDCLIVVFLTHGEIKFDNDEGCDTILNHCLMSHLHTSDALLPVRSVCGYFTNEKCPSLANKPKMFFIQACQDEKKSDELYDMNEVEENIASPSSDVSFPQKDFLIAYSSMPGEKSFRTTGHGSWFIQALCDELNKRGLVDDLTRIMTSVSYRVAFDYVSFEFDIDQNKQMPCIVSRLTKLVFFPKNKSILRNQHMKLLSRCFSPSKTKDDIEF